MPASRTPWRRRPRSLSSTWGGLAAKHIIGKTVGGAGIGAITGAASANPGERMSGALKGGLVGGALGGALGGAQAGGAALAIRKARALPAAEKAQIVSRMQEGMTQGARQILGA